LFFGLPAFESPNHTRKESKVKVLRFFCILIAGKSFVAKRSREPAEEEEEAVKSIVKKKGEWRLDELQK
jgi:hypothetical protein